jgi:hypothetical protein
VLGFRLNWHSDARQHFRLISIWWEQLLSNGTAAVAVP